MNNKGIYVIGVAVVVLLLLLVLKPSGLVENFGGGPGGQTARGCIVQGTTTAFEIGNDNSVSIFSTSSLRAWARIQQPEFATNTVALLFDRGTDAAIGGGLSLVLGGGTSTPNFIDFGLNTDFPYTGHVTGITNSASTTILVTECLY